MKNSCAWVLGLILLVVTSGCSSSEVDEYAMVDESAPELATEAMTDEVPAELTEAPSDALSEEPSDAYAEAPASDMPTEAPTDLSTPPEDQTIAEAEPAPADMMQPDPSALAGGMPEETAPEADAPYEPYAASAGTSDETYAAMEEPASEPYDGGSVKTVRVKRGDTLMKIAFEHYGDLYRWREILQANRSKIADANNVPPGTVLTLNGVGDVTIERNGKKHMIQWGDTLGTISGTVYGTTKRWKALWENNRQLIKDPNKIYAGFYLYYLPLQQLTDAGTAEDESFASQQ
jgi:nucleoid-associated protein YgaU